MKRTLTMLACVLAMALAAGAATPLEEITACPQRSAAGSYAYPDIDLPRLTPAPKGYKPFYVSHYGRHGSRYLGSLAEYMPATSVLEKADSLGMLSATGKATLAKLRKVLPDVEGRGGDLTPLGARQHRDIARRMFYNFPEVFRGKGKRIEGRSSTFLRCIISMTNETGEFKGLNPSLEINTDASQHDMYYIYYWDGNYGKWGVTDSQPARREFAKTVGMDYSRFVNQFFNDASYAASVDAARFTDNMNAIAGIMQGTNPDVDFYGLFTPGELYKLWLMNNVGSYLTFGAAPQSGGLQPSCQRNLLNNIIAQADTAIAGKGNGLCANLRFGHDVVLLPLACFMELGDCGFAVDDLTKLADRWRNYNIMPMAANIQIIFYRNKAGDVLVKALLNEREVTMPGKAVTGPYYRWSALRKYYLDKIARYAKAYDEKVAKEKQ